MAVRPLWIGIGGIGFGILAVLAVAALVSDGSPAPEPGRSVELTFPGVTHDADAAADLVVAWNRWRTATFVSSGVWTRTLDDGESPLSGQVYMAQDPPRRLVLRLGAVIEQIDGDLTTCDGASDVIVVPSCTELSGGRSYDDRVDAEMALVVQYVTGGNRIYDVAIVDGCFRVELLAVALRSPWGRAAEFCFDQATGGLRSSQVRRQSAVDVETNTVLRAEVTDADF